MGSELRVALGRPGETNNIDSRKYGWYSVIMDSYLHMRLIGMKGVEAVPSDSLSSFFGSKGRYGITKTKGQLNGAAKKFGADDFIKVDYSVSGRDQVVSLQVRVYKTGSGEQLLSYATRYPMVSTAEYLDSATLRIARALNIEIDEDQRTKLLTPILVPDMNLVKKLGRAALEINEQRETKYLEKAFSELDGVIVDRNNFWLAYFISGECYEQHKLYEHAAESYNALVERRQFKWPELFIRAARNYRRASLLDKATTILADASSYKVDNISYKYEYAKLMVAKKDYSAAFTAYETLLKSSPKNPDALLFLSEQNNINKKYKIALKQAETLLKTGTYKGKAYLEQGKAYIGLKNESKAIVALRNATSYKGNNSEANILLAEIFVKNKKYDSASTRYNLALKDRPNDAELLINTAQTYKKAKKFKKALKVLENYQSNFKGNLEVEKELGLAYFAVNDTLRAQKSLEKCIDMTPPSEEVLATLSIIYTNQKAWKSVIAVNLKLLPLVKKKTDVNFALGRAYYKDNQYNEAMRYLGQVVISSSTYKMANFYMGEILFSKKEYAKALPHYKNERKLKNSIKIQERIISCEYYTKNYVAARSDAKKLISMKSNSAFAYTQLALISLAEKKYSEAKKYLVVAKKYGKVDPVIYRDLGDGFSKAKIWKEAISSYKSYLLSNKNDDKVYMKLAYAYEQDGQKTNAIEAYITANTLNSAANRETLASAGRLLYSTKQFARADTVYTKYFAQGGTDELAYQNFAAIKFKNKDYQTAITYLDKIQGERKNNKTVIKLYGESKYYVGAYLVAIPYLVKAISYEPKNVELAEMCGVSYEKTNQPAKALPYIAKVVTYGTKSQKREYGFHLAELYFKLGQKDKAEAQYKRNIGRFPSDYRNYEALADYYVSTKRYSETIKLLYKVAPLAAAPAKISKPLAISYENVNNPSKAAIAYERYLKKAKNDSTAWFNLGNIYYKQKKYNKAVIALTNAVRLMPTNKWASYRLANSYYKLGKYKEGEKVLAAVWPSYKTDKDIQKLFSSILLKTKDTTLTIDVYTERAKLEKNNFQLNIDLGNLLFATAQDVKAVQAYERALVIKPRSYATRKKLIEYYVKSKNDPKVFALVQGGLKYYPQKSELYLFRAQYYLRADSTKKAQLDLEKTVALNPKNSGAYFTLGQLYNKIGHKKSAKTAFSKAVNLMPKDTVYRLEYMRSLVALNNLSLAITNGEKLLALTPNNWSNLSEVASIYQKAGKFKEAEALYIKALAVNDNCVVCYRNLGVIYYKEQKFDLAEVNLDKLMKSDTTDFLSNYYLAEIKRNNGMEEEAFSLFKRAHTLDPNNDEVLFKLVNAAVEDDYIDYASQYASSWKGKNKTTWIFAAQARVQEAKGKDKKAISLYNMANQLDKKNAYVYMGLGRLALKVSDYSKADEYFGKALALDPTNIEVYIRMASSYFNQKMYKSARELLLEAKKINSRNPSIYYYLAKVYSRERNHDEAVRVLKQALTATPGSPKIHFALASEMLEAIKPREAIKEFELVLSNDPRGKYSTQVYKLMGDIYYEQLLDNKKAKKYYKKFLRAGGKDKSVKAKLKTL